MPADEDPLDLPEGYDPTLPARDPANVSALRREFMANDNEPWILAAMRAGTHFGFRDKCERNFSNEHFDAVFYGKTEAEDE